MFTKSIASGGGFREIRQSFSRDSNWSSSTDEKVSQESGKVFQIGNSQSKPPSESKKTESTVTFGWPFFPPEIVPHGPIHMPPRDPEPDMA